MAMKAQPEGITRVGRDAKEVGGKRVPATVYDIYWKNPKQKKAKKVHLGHTERDAKGWRPFPISGGAWPEVQPNHTAAVERLLEAYLAAAKRTEEGTAEEQAETEAILSDADTMTALTEAIREEDPVAAAELERAALEHRTGTEIAAADSIASGMEAHKRSPVAQDELGAGAAGEDFPPESFPPAALDQIFQVIHGAPDPVEAAAADRDEPGEVNDDFFESPPGTAVPFSSPEPAQEAWEYPEPDPQPQPKPVLDDADPAGFDWTLLHDPEDES